MEQPRGARWLTALGWSAVVAAYILLVSGVIVTKTESGEGCGRTWPFCHGALLPPEWTIEAIWEYSHRAISGTVGLLVIFVALWAWKAYGQHRWIPWLAGTSILFILLQGALGAYTVVLAGTFAQKPILALHFGFSLMAFAATFLLALGMHRLRRGRAAFAVYPIPARWYHLIRCLLLAVYAVVYTGAWVRHARATLACGTTFPGCLDGSWWPDFTLPSGVHMFHRWSAISLWLLFAVLTYCLGRRKEVQSLGGVFSFAWRRMRWATLLLTCQAVSGVALVLTGGPLWLSLLHTTFVMFAFTALADLALHLQPRGT